MKSRKIISLTVLIVAIALMGILGLSKAFETAWQKENTIDNSLSAEIVDDAGTVFDYPFQINDDMKKVIDTYINNWFSSIEDFRGGFNGEYISQPDKNMITYQQATNSAGEILKYLYGFTRPQNNTATITFFDIPYLSENNRGSTFYSYYNNWSYNDNFDNSVTIEANIFVNPYNGEIMQVIVTDSKETDSDTNIESDIDEHELYQYALEVLKTIGINYEVEECYIYAIGISKEECGITFKLTDEKYYNFVFDLNNNNSLMVFENSSDIGKHEIYVDYANRMKQFRYNNL